jgi:hypothetical protein
LFALFGDSGGSISSVGGCQPAGGLISSIVPHFGQANSCPIADILLTFSRDAQEWQTIVNKDKTNFSLGLVELNQLNWG